MSGLHQNRNVLANFIKSLMWNVTRVLPVVVALFSVEKRTDIKRMRSLFALQTRLKFNRNFKWKTVFVLCFIAPYALWMKESNLLGKVLASSCMVSMHPVRLNISEAVPTHSPLERHQRNTTRDNCITISGRGAISGAARRGALNGCLSTSDRVLTISPALLLEYLFKYRDEATTWSWLNTAEFFIDF